MVSITFVTEEEFKSMIASGDFIEHVCVFGNYYGTSAKSYQTDLSQWR